MNWYRAYFVSKERRICEVVEYVSPSDAAALDHGRGLLTTRPEFAGIEIWQGARPLLLYPQNHSAA
ncbi:MAG TPA: hypothetical protein VHX19_03450 [Stellaceae bacterium]|jgi:hypothetical protein|nr:hypothetical protein [Stellaceae bacterium]